MKAIHTKTKEEFQKVLEIFDKKNWKWYEGEEPLSGVYNWDFHKQNTCIEYDDSFTYTDIQSDALDEIISFDDFLKVEQIKGDSKRFETARIIMQGLSAGGIVDDLIPEMVEKAYKIADELIKQEEK